MRGNGYPAEIRALGGDCDRIGGKACDWWLVQVATLGGVAGSCRDVTDLARLESGWQSLAVELEALPPEYSGATQRFAADRAAFEQWQRDDLASWVGADFTTWPSDVRAFDEWTAHLDAWRQWYRKATGTEPAGPDPIDPGASGGTGIGAALDKATTLALVAGGALIVYQLVRK